MRWDLTTCRRHPSGPTETDAACCFALGPDGQLIAFETWNQEDEEDPTAYEVQVWSLTGRRPRLPDARVGARLQCRRAPQLLDRQGRRESDRCRRSRLGRDPPVDTHRLLHLSDLMVTRWQPDSRRQPNRSGDIRSRGRVEVIRPNLDRVNDPEWLPAGDAIVVGGESTHVWSTPRPARSAWSCSDSLAAPSKSSPSPAPTSSPAPALSTRSGWSSSMPLH